MGSTHRAAERDAGLDLLRATALGLMVFIHVFRLADPSLPGVRTLWLIGEAAPSLFFFAFGMTTGQFLKRSVKENTGLLVLFFYVALAHNALVGNLGMWNFLGFLLMARAITLALGHAAQADARWHLVLFLGLGVLVLATPLDSIGGLVRRQIPGPFPLLPWLLFVIAGHAYARGALGRRAIPAALLGVVVALGIQAAGDAARIENFGLSKWPLTFPYVLLSSAAAVLLVEAGRAWTRHGRRLPGAVMELSRNLLLGTAVHYLPVMLLFYLGTRQPWDLSPGLRTIVVAGFTLIAIATLPLLIRWTRRCFDRLRTRRVPAWLLARPHVSAVIILALTGIPMSFYETARMANRWSSDWPLLLRVFPLLALLWLCLAMDHRRTQRRSAA